MRRTIVIGMGNPVLGDDGVGWRVAEALHGTVNVEVDCLAAGGLDLMERMTGYQRAILIDASFSGHKPSGTVDHFTLESLAERPSGHLGSAHDASLPVALRAGRMLGAELPEQVDIVAIEARQVYDFSEELSPPVAAAVPLAVKRVLELLREEQF